jgi:hypothetical protein
MQKYLIAMWVFLGGGQRRQVHAERLNSDIFRDENDHLVMRVEAEKVPRQNNDKLALPPQLWTTIEYYQQHVWPILLAGRNGNVKSRCKSLWVNAVRQPT